MPVDITPTKYTVYRCSASTVLVSSPRELPLHFVLELATAVVPVKFAFAAPCDVAHNRPEIEHDADWEHHVHSELGCNVLVLFCRAERKLKCATLKISRLSLPIVSSNPQVFSFNQDIKKW